MEGGKEEEEPRSPSGSGFGGKAPPARFPSLECISQLISHTIGLAWLGLTFSFFCKPISFWFRSKLEKEKQQTCQIRNVNTRIKHSVLEP